MDDLGSYFATSEAQSFLKGKAFERLRGNLAAITGCEYCYRKNNLHFDWCRWDNCSSCGHNFPWHMGGFVDTHCRVAHCQCQSFEARHG